MTSPTIRPGTPQDSRPVFEVFEHALADLVQRLGDGGETSASDPEALEAMWEQRRGLYAHLAATNDSFWVAEAGGRPVGYSRAVLRDGVLQPTELFLLPEVQSAGLGRELLNRCVAPRREHTSVIVGTLDVRAQAMYLHHGYSPRTLVYAMVRPTGEAPRPQTSRAAGAGGRPPRIAATSGVRWDPITGTDSEFETLGDIDMEVLGFRRRTDHAWLLSDRQGYIYRIGEEAVGYGYVGPRFGPFAARDPAVQPEMIRHAEGVADDEGVGLHFEVPGTNRTAVKVLLDRGYRIDALMACLMTTTPFGQFDRYLLTTPPFIV